MVGLHRELKGGLEEGVEAAGSEGGAAPTPRADYGWGRGLYIGG